MITKKHIYIIGIIATASLFSSCDFEKVNTNEFELRTEEGKMDGITLGGPITAMQKCVVPIGTQADGTKHGIMAIITLLIIYVKVGYLHHIVLLIPT